MIITKFDNDIPVEWCTGDTDNDGVYVADNSNIFALRILDNNVVDVSKLTSFFVCENGKKHIKKFDDSWQKIECNLNDELELINGVWRVIDNKNSTVLDQYRAIDTHIAQCIKSNGWDYDNIGEIAAYALLSDTYKVEARAVWSWVEACHVIQSNIKNGVVKYDSVGDVLDALPVFDIHA